MSVPSSRLAVDGGTILVSAIHDLLVDKLCALLGRSELRDLVDVRALLESGADLDRGLGDAPRRDAGFSPLTLTWTLRGLDVERLGALSGIGPAEIGGLLEFRDELVARVAKRIQPAP